jgi:SAM-dependent methyltransferase
MVRKDNKYTQMRLNLYNGWANLWSEDDRDWVVGNFDDHNNWKTYDLLFERIANKKDKVGLDFGCGPGRNIVKYRNEFKRMDGVDISPINIQKAEGYVRNHGLDSKLYVNNGVDLEGIDSNMYDFVMSTICLQHICVYNIRYSIFKDIYRVLKKGGIFTAQMGYGPETPMKTSVGYYRNYYEADNTNGKCDTRVEDYNFLRMDLEKIGFSDFQYKITETGPADHHLNWIFFSAIK